MHQSAADLCFVASGGCVVAAASGYSWLPLLGSIASTLVSLWASERARRLEQQAESQRNQKLVQELALLRCQQPTEP